MTGLASTTFRRRVALLPALLAFLGCRLGDLVSTPAASPALPAGLAQAKSDGITAIAQGGTTNEPAVTITASVSDLDANDQITLEVEVRPVGVAFSDSATLAATPVASGATATVAVSGLTENMSYHWQARAADQTGRASAWVTFGTNPESGADFHVDAVAEAPVQPASLAQLKSDGVTAIAVGAATEETTVQFQATLSDPDAGDSLRLQVERQPLGTQFTNTTPSVTSVAVASGGTARVALAGHLDNVSYHWQARTIDRSGLTSPWESFGGNPEVQTDYRVDAPETPAAPVGLGQFQQNGQTPIPIGGTVNQQTVVFEATVADPDAADQIRLELEHTTVDQSFTGTVTATSALVSSGAAAKISVTGIAVGSYHWQVRAVDQTGRASAWVKFGGNLDGETDFRVP